MTEPPADLLRRAANLIEQHAEHATPGPWEIGHDHLKPDQASHLFVGCAPANCNNVDCYDGTHGIGYLDTDGDVRWAALMHPRLAAPLAAWLRAIADEYADAQDERRGDCQDCHGTGEVYDGDPLPFPCSSCRVEEWEQLQSAIALARVLLGEDQP